MNQEEVLKKTKGIEYKIQDGIEKNNSDYSNSYNSSRLIDPGRNMRMH